DKHDEGCRCGVPAHSRWKVVRITCDIPRSRPPESTRSIERIPVCRLSAYLWPRRLGVTWGNGGPHSGYRHLADKDEVPGSSPGRPTPSLTRGNGSRTSRSALGVECAGQRPLT